VRSYTIGQLEAFTVAARRLERESTREQLLIIRAAQADPKGFKRVLDALDQRGE